MVRTIVLCVTCAALTATAFLLANNRSADTRLLGT